MAMASIARTTSLLDLAGTSAYRQRDPTKTAAWQAVHEHWQDYRAEVARSHDCLSPPISPKSIPPNLPGR